MQKILTILGFLYFLTLYKINCYCYDIELYKDKCIERDGCFWDGLALCQECDTSCKNCEKNKYTCTECYEDRFLLNSKCEGQCPGGYFGNLENNKCEICNEKCSRCQDTATNCSECNESYYLSGSTCLDCDSKCQMCEKQADNCQSCLKGFYFFQNQCLENCPDGYYGDQQFQCQQCDIKKCKTCKTTNSNCTSCNDQTYLFSTECIIECPDRYFEQQSDNTCQKCDQSCKICIKNAKDCTKCYDGYYLQDSQCNTSCSTGFYGDDNINKCVECNSQCLDCKNSGTNCISCKDGKYLINNQCQKQCPDTYYGDNESNQCLECDKSCLNCQNSATECTKCQNNLYLYNNKCIKECPDKYYENSQDNVCQSCDVSCLNCQESAKNCISCKSNTYLYENTCKSKCPDTFYGDNKSNTCLQCNKSCLNCSGSASQCTSCNDGQFLFNKICQDTCPTNYFEDKQNNKCQQCDKCCYSCSDISNNCDQCKSGYYLYENNCKSNCPDGFYGNIENNTCIKCPKQCIQCQQGSKKEIQCQECDLGYFLSGNDCLKNCKNGEYEDKQTGKCLPCGNHFKNGQCKECSYVNNQDGDGEYLYCQWCNKGYTWNQSQKNCVVQNLVFWSSMRVIIIVATIVLLLIIFCIVYFYYRKQKNDQQIHDKQEQLEENNKLLQEQLNQNARISDLQDQVNISNRKSQDNNYYQSPQHIIDLNKNNVNINNNFNSDMSSVQIQQTNRLSSYTEDQIWGQLKQITEYQSCYVIDKDRFKLLFTKTGNLGEGSFAVVDKYLDIRSQTEVAIKKFKFTNNKAIFQEGLKEARYLEIINQHTDKIIRMQRYFILQSIENFREKKRLMLQFELAEYSLHQKVKEQKLQQKFFTEEQVKDIFYNLVQGMNTLHHKLKIAHRDLKPRNILYKNGWKIGDLGGAKQQQFSHFGGGATQKHSLVGTLAYLSPEQKKNYVTGNVEKHKSDPYNTYKSDVFSFGLVIFEVMTFSNLEGMNDNSHNLKVSIKNKLLNNNRYDKRLIELVQKMLQWHPNDRITFSQLNQEINIIENQGEQIIVEEDNVENNRKLQKDKLEIESIIQSFQQAQQEKDQKEQQQFQEQELEEDEEDELETIKNKQNKTIQI